MKKVITILITFLILLSFLAGCHTAHEVEEAYNRGYVDGYLDGQKIASPTPTPKQTTKSYTAPEDLPAYSGAFLLPGPDPTSTPDSTAPPQSDVHDYVLNTNSHKFHYPDCSSVGQMKDSNKKYFTGTREEVIAMGYDPCGNCNP